MSLLSQAKAVRGTVKRNDAEASKELIELAVAVVKHEVTFRQAAVALGLKGTNKVANRITQAIFSAVRTGQLK